jgi:hypothetical protein
VFVLDIGWSESREKSEEHHLPSAVLFVWVGVRFDSCAQSGSLGEMFSGLPTRMSHRISSLIHAALCSGRGGLDKWWAKK